MQQAPRASLKCRTFRRRPSNRGKSYAFRPLTAKLARGGLGKFRNAVSCGMFGILSLRLLSPNDCDPRNCYIFGCDFMSGADFIGPAALFGGSIGAAIGALVDASQRGWKPVRLPGGTVASI